MSGNTGLALRGLALGLIFVIAVLAAAATAVIMRLSGAKPPMILGCSGTVFAAVFTLGLLSLQFLDA